MIALGSVSRSLSRIRVCRIYMFDRQIGIQQSRTLIATINQSTYTNIDIFNSRSVSCYYNRYIGNLYNGVDHLSLCSKHLFKTVFTPSLFWSGESENCFSRSGIISIGNIFSTTQIGYSVTSANLQNPRMFMPNNILSLKQEISITKLNNSAGKSRVDQTVPDVMHWEDLTVNEPRSKTLSDLS